MTVLLPLLVMAAPTPGVTWQKNVEYATVDGTAVQFDVAVPPGDGPFPGLVMFHGGGWKFGRRTDVAGYAKYLAEAGYLSVTVGYRLAPKHKWPAQIEDAKTAVRFLRQNAARFKLQPERLAAMGFSSGAHLALLLGLTDKAAGFDGTLYPDQSSKPQCVVDFFGPTDLTLYAESPGLEHAYFETFLGGTFAQKPDVYRKASPLTYAGKHAPPLLIVHGTADIFVPVIHSERLHRKLTDAGAACELVTVPAEGHGWGGDEANRSAAKAVRFLDKHLKGAK